MRMGKIFKIGIAGCGAIGTSLARSVAKDFSGSAQLSGLYDIELEKAYKLASEFSNQKLAALNLDDLIGRVDLVIEATKAECAFEIAKKVVLASRNIIIMSVGGIIENFQELSALAEEKNVSILIPSGAICGIDAVKASACGKINKITLTTIKPPKAFIGNPYVLKRQIRLDNIESDTVIYEGDALTAIRIFPQNINVAATLSLAGIGPKNTVVRIIASPHASANIHQIEVDSEAGKIVTRTENIAHPDNPKTSYLAVLSAIATLKQVLEPFKIGT